MGFKPGEKIRIEDGYVYINDVRLKESNDYDKIAVPGIAESDILLGKDEYFVLGLANAIALDVKWQSEFECNNTREEKFNLINNQNKSVEMMHKTYHNGDAKYLKNDEVTGIILPYEESDNVNLEFMAIMPNDLDTYINNLTQDKLNKTIEDFKDILDDEEVNLSLPRFTYEYEIKNFINVLNKMGINSAFNTSADFSNMIDFPQFISVWNNHRGVKRLLSKFWSYEK